MYTLRLTAVFVILCGAFFASSNFAAPKQIAYRKDALILCSKDGAAFDVQGVKTIKNLGQTGCKLVETGADVFEAKILLEQTKNLDVSLDYLVSIDAGQPSDTYFAKQWALKNTGINNGVAGIDMGVLPAWDISAGSKNDVVGIIDTGCMYRHQDLAANMWRNPGEIAGNGIDDDKNGYIDDVHGINAITNTGDPLDDNGHGTHVAGTIGAVTNNRRGIAGVSPKAQMACCKFLSKNGSGYTSDAITCIDYFTQMKTRVRHPANISVVNNSWGGGDFTPALLQSVKNMKAANILFVAAAGNSHDNNDEVPSNPASLEVDNIVAVAAYNNAGNLASFSNYGQHSVHVSAPGENIISTAFDGTYATMSGTSMAAPHVAGLALLLKGQNPNYTYVQVRNLIIAGGVPDSRFVEKSISQRRVKAAAPYGYGSLTCLDQVVQSRLKPMEDALILPLGSSLNLKTLAIVCDKAQLKSQVRVFNDNLAIAVIDLNDSETNNGVLVNDGIFENIWKPVSAGKYLLQFAANDSVKAEIYEAGDYKFVTRPYEYVEISGTALDLKDESKITINAPFGLHFGSKLNSFSTVSISDNGALSLGVDRFFDSNNQSLPLADQQTVVAGFWDDLKPDTQAKIHYAVVGEAPQRKFIIEWRNVKHYNLTTGDGVTFQIIFSEDNSDIIFNYKDVVFGDSTIDKGKSATVGVQSSSNSAAQYSFKQALLASGKSIAANLKLASP